MKRLILASLLLLSGCVVEEYPGVETVPPPRNLKIASANNGLYVKLTWEAPDSGIPDGYIIYFKSIFDSTFRPIDTTAALYDIINPGDTTGYYYVRAYIFEIGVSDSSNVVSTVPVLTRDIELYELDLEQPPLFNSGFGFDTLSGAGYTYPMREHTFCPRIDFYLTNLDTGWTGTYYFMSPHRIYRFPHDSSLINFRCEFKSTKFDRVQYPMRDHILPPLEEGGLFGIPIMVNNFVEALLIEVCTGDGYYGLIYIDPTAIDTVNGKVRFDAYFQKVRGLRLIRHR